MTSELGKRLRLLGSVLSVLALLAAAAAVWFYFQMRASLPQLDGSRRLAGLGHPVTITRDALGVPSVVGSNRADVARALGFLHAQDRYFQMDTLRRRAAGELAEVFGRAALPSDRSIRPHRFRALAEQVLARLSADQRALLESYAAGASAGLAALGRPPFEYLVVRADPTPWRPEDSLLVAYAMTLELQDAANTYEHSLSTLRDKFGNAAVGFFAPLLTPDDAALDGSTAPLPPIPGPGVLNLRPGASARAVPARPALAAAGSPPDAEFRPGSNSFAVTGAHTTHGGAMLANDPHLSLGVPNIWYRALLEWPEAGAEAGRRRVVGVTIPGLPFVVLGSNGQIAWGLTDAYADTNDLVAVDAHPKSDDLYLIPGRAELATVEMRQDTIKVKGAAPVTVETRWTHWGPIIGIDSRDRPLAHHWVAHDPGALNLDFLQLEQARNVAEAVDVAHRAGIPAHNFLVADSTGRIAWTVIGKFPRRVGFDGRLPVSWGYGDRRWEGFVAAGDVPTVMVPAQPKAGLPLVEAAEAGRLWTANNRIVGGEALARLGDGGYAAPARAAQIRDALARIQTATPRDFLAMQLDDRAVFLERWQRLLLTSLTPPAVEQKRGREQFRTLAATAPLRAETGSVAFRLVRAFRNRTADLVLNPIFAGCLETNPEFDWRRFNFEPALWALLEQRPGHLLAPSHQTWDDLLLAAVDQVMADLAREGVSLDRATWGDANRARITHPLGRVLPRVFAHWLNLPADPLAGDGHMPRIQTPSFGASMRLVVSPGHEAEGLFEMPGGQSGHPLSRFYRAGHAAWVRGEPAPLLPGAPRHTLVLQP